MLGFIVIITAIIFAIIAPAISLIKYYHPSQQNILVRIFWIIVTILTWPTVPIVMATRRSDKIILGLFWGSFIIMAVATWYWCLLNVGKLIQFQQFLLTGAK